MTSASRLGTARPVELIVTTPSICSGCRWPRDNACAAASQRRSTAVSTNSRVRSFHPLVFSYHSSGMQEYRRSYRRWRDARILLGAPGTDTVRMPRHLLDRLRGEGRQSQGRKAGRGASSELARSKGIIVRRFVNAMKQQSRASMKFMLPDNVISELQVCGISSVSLYMAEYEPRIWPNLNPGAQ